MTAQRKRGEVSPHHERVRHLVGSGDPDALGLQIFPDRILTVLAAETRALVAAEGRHVADGAVGVDPHSPRLQPLGGRERPFHSLRPDPGGKAVRAVIADPDRLLVVAEADHRKHGPEHLLAGYAHLVVDAGEDGGLDEPALAAFRALRWTAAENAI